MVLLKTYMYMYNSILSYLKMDTRQAGEEKGFSNTYWFFVQEQEKYVINKVLSKKNTKIN